MKDWQLCKLNNSQNKSENSRVRINCNLKPTGEYCGQIKLSESSVFTVCLCLGLHSRPGKCLCPGILYLLLHGCGVWGRRTFSGINNISHRHFMAELLKLCRLLVLWSLLGESSNSSSFLLSVKRLFRSNVQMGNIGFDGVHPSRAEEIRCKILYLQFRHCDLG